MLHVATQWLHEDRKQIAACLGLGESSTPTPIESTVPDAPPHAERNQQTDRAAIYNRLLDGLPAHTG